jgi:hypothetical protein
MRKIWHLIPQIKPQLMIVCLVFLQYRTPLRIRKATQTPPNVAQNQMLIPKSIFTDPTSS